MRRDDGTMVYATTTTSSSEEEREEIAASTTSSSSGGTTEEDNEKDSKLSSRREEMLIIASNLVVGIDDPYDHENGIPIPKHLTPQSIPQSILDAKKDQEGYAAAKTTTSNNIFNHKEICQYRPCGILNFDDDDDEEEEENVEVDDIENIAIPDSSQRRFLRQRPSHEYEVADGNQNITSTISPIPVSSPEEQQQQPQLTPGKSKQAQQRRRRRRRTATAEVIATGSLPNLVIPIRFQDHKIQQENNQRILPTREEIDILMNHDGPHPTICPTGSVRDVYHENSYGKLTIKSTVLDWVDVPYNEIDIGDGESGLSNKIKDLLRTALDIVRDTQQQKQESESWWKDNFDLNDDGKIDAITFLHSGYGAEWGGFDDYGQHFSNRIWSHKWSLGKNKWKSGGGSNSVEVKNYHISPALWSIRGNEIGRIGVISHELGHFLGTSLLCGDVGSRVHHRICFAHLSHLAHLYPYSRLIINSTGLPDYYDSDGNGSGLGTWGLMANSWGWDGSQLYPPEMCSYNKIELGWLEPQEVQYGANQISALADQNANYPQVYKVTHNFPEGEYLLIENRFGIGYDSMIPGRSRGGLAIYHIDENAESLDEQGFPGQVSEDGTPWPYNGYHYRVALLQADGQYNLEKNQNRGGSHDVFYQRTFSRRGPFESNSKTAIGPSTGGGTTNGDYDGPYYPNTDSYQDGNVYETSNWIFDISESGTVMTFKYTNEADDTDWDEDEDEDDGGDKDDSDADDGDGDGEETVPTASPNFVPSMTPTKHPVPSPSSMPIQHPSSSPVDIDHCLGVRKECRSNDMCCSGICHYSAKLRRGFCGDYEHDTGNDGGSGGGNGGGASGDGDDGDGGGQCLGNSETCKSNDMCCSGVCFYHQERRVKFCLGGN